METAYAVEAESPKAYREQPQKRKKPGFIKRWLVNSIKNVIEYENESKQAGLGIGLIEKTSTLRSNRIGIADQSPELDKEKCIRFNVYNANGGRVIETNRYDRQKDRHINNLYVITSDQDFGREIDKIITMEHLR